MVIGHRLILASTEKLNSTPTTARLIVGLVSSITYDRYLIAVEETRGHSPTLLLYNNMHRKNRTNTYPKLVSFAVDTALEIGSYSLTQPFFPSSVQLTLLTSRYIANVDGGWFEEYMIGVVAYAPYTTLCPTGARNIPVAAAHSFS